MARFVIGNMSCGGCVASVTATLRQADPAARVEVVPDRREVTVSGGRADDLALLHALEADGWQASMAAG